jgi:hypothetical protein
LKRLIGCQIQPASEVVTEFADQTKRLLSSGACQVAQSAYKWKTGLGSVNEVLTGASEKSKGFNPARPKENAINLVFGMEGELRQLKVS